MWACPDTFFVRNPQQQPRGAHAYPWAFMAPMSLGLQGQGLTPRFRHRLMITSYMCPCLGEHIAVGRAPGEYTGGCGPEAWGNVYMNLLKPVSCP